MLESFQPHPAASFPDAAVGEREIDNPHKPRPGTPPHTVRGTSSSASRPEQSRSPVSRLPRSRRHCYCTLLHEIDISRDPAACKKLRDEFLHPSNRDHSLPACTGNAPSEERQSSAPCSQSRDREWTGADQDLLQAGSVFDPL